MREDFGLEAPMTPRFVQRPAMRLIGTGPHQWLALSDTITGHMLTAALQAKLCGIASIADQTDGRTILRLQGPNVRDVLAKGVPVDLHPRVFGPGDSASITVGHVGVQLWQLDALPTYEFAVPRSLSASLCGWLTDAAAQFGCKIIL
jgi:methylglutamate dehydrogenase subunit D